MNAKQAIGIIEGSLAVCEYLANQGLNCDPLIMANKAALQALQDQEERENPKRLTIEELKSIHAPIWVSCFTLEGDPGYWCLCRKGIITCPSGDTFRASEIPHWKFYRHKPKEG